ncbi:MAG TPA: hypothetical protein VMO88_12290, partial [Acidimicrobiales bacterium]|nr:hypothetical protein [Acidimicrobiales bacterium]
HLRFVERSARKMARNTFYGMARWQGGMERKQAFLGRIVDIGADLWAMSAVVVRAKMIEEGSVGSAAFETDGGDGAAEDLADLFCRQARRRVDQAFHDLWHNDDDEEYSAAMRVLEGRYTFFEQGILDPSGDGPMIDSTGNPPAG